MSGWQFRWLSWLGFCAGSAALCGIDPDPAGGDSRAVAAAVFYQQEEQDLPEGLEVRAKGPVHEAYATPAVDSRPTPIVPVQPPEPIEELPPEQRPEGDNVVWIPGYWHWDEEERQYVWVSGFWRVVPPGQVWVPGWWRAVEGGWQWVPGFWQSLPANEAGGGPAPADIQYLPEPPADIEVGPSIPAPTATSFYVPGCWVWRGRYVWRPGFWWEFRPGWVWVPAHYRWTPLGWVFVPGFWDYPLAARGILFAPVVIQPVLWRRPAFVYTPTYVISEPALFGALFVRRGWSCYFFGDYFGPRYLDWGFSAWCGRFGPRGGFTIGFGTGVAWGYDPLWSYYSLAFRQQPAWFNGLNTLYLGRFRGDLPRPPVNLAQQNIVINNITQTNIRNVTNNIAVVNRSVVVNKTDVTAVALLAPLKAAGQLQPEVGLRPAPPDIRQREAQQAKQLREMALQRAKVEAAAKAPQGKQPLPVAGAVRNLQLQVPAEVARRALPPGPNRQPPPSPGSTPAPKRPLPPEPKNKAETPKGEPKPQPKGKIEPKSDPKGPFVPPQDPKPKPPVDPSIKPDPKGQGNTPFVPKIDPKADPKGKVTPKELPILPGPTVPKDKTEVKVDPKGTPKGKAEPQAPLVGKGVKSGEVPPPLPTTPLDKRQPSAEPKVLPKGGAEKVVPPMSPPPRDYPPPSKESLPPPAKGYSGKGADNPTVRPSRPIPTVPAGNPPPPPRIDTGQPASPGPTPSSPPGSPSGERKAPMSAPSASRPTPTVQSAAPTQPRTSTLQGGVQSSRNLMLPDRSASSRSLASGMHPLVIRPGGGPNSNPAGATPRSVPSGGLASRVAVHGPLARGAYPSGPGVGSRVVSPPGPTINKSPASAPAAMRPAEAVPSSRRSPKRRC
ncbi:MAG: hypothetical protein NZU63_05400 [Gemmataceae bacterium]|nr:hypothetical protein [Gemmataceae bacterium]MDW8243414.1 hypothetical protein [Thermogemmata sp.]